MMIKIMLRPSGLQAAQQLLSEMVGPAYQAFLDQLVVCPTPAKGLFG